MKKNKKISCPLCYEVIYTGLGKGCRMCGMKINPNEEFCSEICEEEYGKINQRNNPK